MILAPAILLIPTAWPQAQETGVTQSGAPKTCSARLLGRPALRLTGRVDVPRFNRLPSVTFSVEEDGSIRSLTIAKTTRSPKFDRAILAQVIVWKFAAAPGCELRDATVKIVSDLR